MLREKCQVSHFLLHPLISLTNYLASRCLGPKDTWTHDGHNFPVILVDKGWHNSKTCWAKVKLLKWLAV